MFVEDKNQTKMSNKALLRKKIKNNGKKTDSFNKLKIFRRKTRINGEPLKGELFQARNNMEFQDFAYKN